MATQGLALHKPQISRTKTGRNVEDPDFTSKPFRKPGFSFTCTAAFLQALKHERQPEHLLKRHSSSDEEACPSGLQHQVQRSGQPLKKTAVRISLKIVIPAAGVLVIGALVAVFIITGPKPSQPPQPPVEKPRAHVSAQPLAAPSPEKEAFQPLAEADASPKNAGIQAPPPSPRRQEARPARQRVQHPARAEATDKSHVPEAAKPDISPLEKLKSAYESDDYFTIGKRAFQKSEYRDAVLALTKVPKADPNYDKASLMLLDTYIESGRFQDAQSLAQNEPLNDAYYFFLRGKLAQKQGRNKDALNFFQTALTKPCAVRSLAEVRTDALYYTAVASQVMYISDPSPDNKGMALQAWLVVKNAYRNNPDHPRYKKAAEEMANIK